METFFLFITQAPFTVMVESSTRQSLGMYHLPNMFFLGRTNYPYAEYLTSFSFLNSIGKRGTIRFSDWKAANERRLGKGPFEHVYW